MKCPTAADLSSLTLLGICTLWAPPTTCGNAETNHERAAVCSCMLLGRKAARFFASTRMDMNFQYSMADMTHDKLRTVSLVQCR